MQNSEIDTYISMNIIQNKHKYNTSITNIKLFGSNKYLWYKKCKTIKLKNQLNDALNQKRN